MLATQSAGLGEWESGNRGDEEEEKNNNTNQRAIDGAQAAEINTTSEVEVQIGAVINQKLSSDAVEFTSKRQRPFSTPTHEPTDFFLLLLSSFDPLSNHQN